MKRKGSVCGMRLEFSRSLSVAARVLDLLMLVPRTINSRLLRSTVMVLSSLGCIAAVECADAAEQPFYAGKTITVVIATAPGGTGHLRYTTVMKQLPRYLPGNPTIVPQYMPRTGGVAAANHLAHVAKRDGFTSRGSSSALYTSARL